MFDNMLGQVIKKSPSRKGKTESDIARMFIGRFVDENHKYESNVARMFIKRSPGGNRKSSVISSVAQPLGTPFTLLGFKELY